MVEFSTFDATFDPTFADYIVFNELTAPATCQLAGTHVAWLSATGWAYYLFRGNADRDIIPIAASSFEQAGVTLDGWRIGQQSLIVRAPNLTQFDADILSNIIVSPAVYLLDTNSRSKVIGIRVRVEPSTLPIWRDSGNRLNMEFKLLLPKRKYQMA